MAKITAGDHIERYRSSRFIITTVSGPEDHRKSSRQVRILVRWGNRYKLFRTLAAKLCWRYRRQLDGHPILDVVAEVIGRGKEVA